MKTGNNTIKIAMFALAAGLMLTGYAPPLRAAGLPTSMPMPALAAAAGSAASVPGAASAPEIMPPPNVADTLNKAVAPMPVASIPSAPVPAENGAKGLSNAEDRAAESVKSVIKRLGSTDNMTLDDLNSARQASAKIEALIEVEKRMAELEKLRETREGNRGMNGNVMSGAMNASALAMPVPQPSSIPAMAAANLPPPTYMPSIDVARIIGSDGHYSAVINEPGGQTKTVKVGDRLGEGTVVAINSAGIQVERNKVRRVIQVKNVETVFGNGATP